MSGGKKIPMKTKSLIIQLQRTPNNRNLFIWFNFTLMNNHSGQWRISSGGNLNFIHQLLFKQRSAFLRYEQRNVNIFQPEEATYGFFAFIRSLKVYSLLLDKKKVSKKFGMQFKTSCKVFSNLFEKCSFCSYSFTFFSNFFFDYLQNLPFWLFLLTHSPAALPHVCRLGASCSDTKR